MQSALDGYKVCIFAYGQTGSGKTYTMVGPGQGGAHAGVIPRAVQQLFESSSQLAEQGWSFEMKVTTSPSQGPNLPILYSSEAE